MGDLLIKNLELPKEGRIQLSVYPNGKVINHSSFTDTTLLSVELPPHGRLIDADTLQEFIVDLAKNTTFVFDAVGCHGLIGTAPTVLEASEVEND